MKTASGLLLGERYRLVRQIAVGGMGEVWEAYDDALARPVAVKVLRAEFAGDRGFLERFRTEARNSASLSHPNIAQLFDYGEQEGSGFLIMELVVGEPLSDLLEREPVLPHAHACCRSSRRRRAPCTPRTWPGWCTATSSRATSCWAAAARVKITDFGVSAGPQPGDDDGDRHGDGHRAVPVPGAGRRQAGDRAVGPVLARDHRVRGARRAPAVHRSDGRSTSPSRTSTTPVPPLPASVDKPLAALVLRLLSKEPTARPASGEELAQLLDKLVPRTPPSGIPVLISKLQRTPDTFATGVHLGRSPPPPVPPPSYPPRRTRRAEEPTGRAAARRASTTHRGAARAAPAGCPGRSSRSSCCSSACSARHSRTRITKRRRPCRTAEPGSRRPAAHYPRADAPDGMITDNGSAAFAADPASTEAKDA